MANITVQAPSIAPEDAVNGLRVNLGRDDETGLDVRDLLLLLLKETRIQTFIMAQAFAPAVKFSDVEQLRNDGTLLTS